MSTNFDAELERVLAWVQRTYGPGLRQSCQTEFEKRKLAGETFDPYEVFEALYTSNDTKIEQFAPSKFYGNVTIE